MEYVDGEDLASLRGVVDGFALFGAALLWLLYIAVEPYVRRTIPTVLVSWSRLLAGGFGDPVVGRDLLIGCAVGAAGATLACVAVLLPSWLGRPAERLMPTRAILDLAEIVGSSSYLLAVSIFTGLAVLFLLFVGKLVLRRRLLAAAAVIIVVGLPGTLNCVNPLLVGPVVFLSVALSIGTLARAGLLAFVVSVFVHVALLDAPSILPFGAWHSGLGLTMTGMLAALAMYGFYRSLAGRSAFGTLSLDA